MATAKKPTCKFGSKCYRKNTQHFEEYYHPEEDEDTKQEKQEEVEEVQPPKKKKKIEDFFGKANTESKKTKGNTSGYVREEPEEKEEDDEAETKEVKSDNESDTEAPPESPADPKENIKTKFLVEMPEDFYDFWEFAKSINSKNPSDALMSKLGLQLVGPYDILAGKHKKCKKSKRPNYLRHWRYYYDPPEFLTVLRGDDKTQFHMGYFRDDPQEMPVFVASNMAEKDCIISPRGGNIFGAVDWFITDIIKKDKSKKDSFEKLQKSLQKFAEKHGHSLEGRTAAMKARAKNVVCKSFHGAGIVVPVDENEVGYRPVPEGPADLKKMLKKIVDSKDEDERNKNFDPLMEIIMYVQFANDECDYGEGLELGIDLFSYGSDVFHSNVKNLMPLAYQLLKRPQFAQIITAHLKNRRSVANLSELE